MAFANVTYTATGASQNLSVPFPYISKSHVKVYVAGVLKTQDVDYTWLTSSTIQITATNGAAILIKRVTPNTERLVDFQDGVPFREADLDLGETQLFYLIQEALDSSDSLRTDLLQVIAGTSGGNSTVQAGISMQDEGVALGSTGTVKVLDIRGGSVVASRSGDTVTLTITSTSGGPPHYVSSLDPATADTVEGSTWLDLTTGILYVRFDDGDTKQWVEFAGASGGGGSAGGGGFTYGPSAPVSPQSGDRWFNSSTGILFTWVDDGTSTQWAQL